MLEMGTKRSAKIMKLGKNENMTKLYFCGLSKSVKKEYPLQVSKIVFLKEIAMIFLFCNYFRSYCKSKGFRSTPKDCVTREIFFQSTN